MPSRSLCVHPDWIETVQQAYESAYVSSRCPNQQEFVDRIPVSPTKVGLSIDTLNQFRKGESVDRENFYALCDRIGLKAEQITVARLEETEVMTEAPPKTALDVAANEPGGELVTLPPVDDEYLEEPNVKEIIEENIQNLSIVEGTAVNKVDQMSIDGSEDETSSNDTTDLTEGAARKTERNCQSAKEVRAGGILINKANRINYHSGN